VTTWRPYDSAAAPRGVYAIKSAGQHFEAESDEELEAALRRELIEIARLNGVNDPDT
jgi:hypothetical protein